MAHFLFLVGRMRQDFDQLRQLLEPVVEAMDYELVGLEFHPHRGNALLRVFIDTDSGITLADCQEVSHQLSGLLDVENPISGRYTLEVSSPGLDRPLFKAEHFNRFTGHQVRIYLVEPLNGRKKLTGCLLGMQDKDVVIEREGNKLIVPLEQIEKARLIPKF